MKKILLPIAVIAVSGAYVWSQQGRLEAGSELDASLPAITTPGDALTLPSASADPALSPPEPAPKPKLAAQPRPEPQPTQPAMTALALSSPPPQAPASKPVQTAVTDSAPAIPMPRPRPKQVQLVAAASSSTGLRDGAFTGPVEDAYYGLVQVQAMVQGGQLVKVRVLQYPNDRRTSRYINGQALPMLQQEAIQAQNANIDYVSGATLSSGAFVKSLAGAIRQATG
jgi:uncharacterized protein with FMN-binding domain